MYSSGIERAIRISLQAHAGQLRKGAAEVPYAVHPLHVAFMLARLGMGELAIQAALLHDVVEDCDEWTVQRVSFEFGADVAAIVAELTEDKSFPWEERKRLAREHVEHMSANALAVKAADKLHNLESLVAELRAADDPALVWQRFNGGREGTLRVARELVLALAPRLDARFSAALCAALAELERLSQPD